MRNLSLAVTADPSPADIAFIEDNLTLFNRAASDGVADDKAPLCVFARDGDGTVIGGATGHTRWGWLYVDCFWLPAAARKDGLGGEIIELAEREARRRGCDHAYLFTYTFQARGFYEKQGYAVFGIQDNFPPGHSKIWMKKDLGVGPAG